MTDFVEIEGRRVGTGCPVFIIAEIGVNHNGELSLAKKLVDAAITAGADAVKFQTFKAEDICTEDAGQAEYQIKNTGKKESQQEMLKGLELSYEDHVKIKKYCDEKGIIFCSTPHSSTKDVDLLESLNVPLYKIGSGDLTNLPILDYIARKGKLMIIATGMGTLKEVYEAYETVLNAGNNNIVFLHSTSNYPFAPEEANLLAIETLRKEIPTLIGYSDNGNRYDVPILATLMGSVVVEKHFTLDRNLPGPDHKASLEPQELASCIAGIRLAEKRLQGLNKSFLLSAAELIIEARKISKELTIPLDTEIIPVLLGNGIKEPMPAELRIAEMARKSIVAATDLPAGKIIEKKDLLIKRPGTGLRPKLMFGKNNLVVGKKLNRSLKKDQLLSLGHLESDKDLDKTVDKRKILYVSGTRADYGLMKHTLQEIKNHPSLDLIILATGMHLMPEFGNTIDLVRKDGFAVREVNAVFREDTKAAMSLFIGEFIQKATAAVQELKPDIILVLGDRAEMLGAAMIGTYLSIPVAHLHGGEVSSTVDEHVRHAITKLAHLHLPATQKSAERIHNLGEEESRIHMVGAPGLDGIVHTQKLRKAELEKYLNLDLSKPTALVIQHSVSAEMELAAAQMQATLEAVQEAGLQAVIIYPNTDAGGRKIIEVIEKYRTNPSFSIHKNIPHEQFISAMSHVGVMVGNSSSGIIEAASFGLPVVNIGSRQDGRERAANVIDVGHSKEEIKNGIRTALAYKHEQKSWSNPYGDGNAAERIVQILSSLEIHKNLIQKRLRY